MKTEQQQLSDMHDRVLQVFPDDLWQTFEQQQRNLANNAMDRVIQKEGPEALTVDRLEGIKELVTQHLWSPALTEASIGTPDSISEKPEAPPVGNARPDAGEQQDSGLIHKPEPMPSTRRRNCLILNPQD